MKKKTDDRRRHENNREWNGKKPPIPKIESDMDTKLGFHLFEEGEPRLGWLLTFASSSWEDQDTGNLRSCIDLYFVTQNGSYFKCKYKFRPYFYVGTKEHKQQTEVEAFLRRRFEGQIFNIEAVEKEDLALKNHLSGLKKPFLRLHFDTLHQLNHAKNDIIRILERNLTKSSEEEAYDSLFLSGRKSNQNKPHDFIESLTDVREYDVPYHVRFAIDSGVRCGQWYDVRVSSGGGVSMDKRADMLQLAEVTICAFDIETTKLPLKFPDSEYDQIMMISYMVNGRGYLIINRECVSEDVSDLEYTPKPEFEGFFEVSNVKNEEELLRAWFCHMRSVRPGIYVTYNGDFFDWPFIEKRAEVHGVRMVEEIGFSVDDSNECRSRFACHLDCFAWVKRDSYLPQGSQGLKAVTKAKLGYDPVEVNPEDMVNFARERPQMMASYSVSDAVATYYLYTTYVHPFIFSLATIIPMLPDEVLRKGSGTLCEMLLMVEAYKANVICPNKYRSEEERFYKNRLVESETYIGGHVECLETGVFRSDIPTSFKLDPSAYEQLLGNLDRDLEFAVTVEGGMDLDSVSNFAQVRKAIADKLKRLQGVSVHEETPLIYHLDVAAMYPNIILTNRLQPPSIVSDEICTACDFNRPGKRCLRRLEWVWRGETYMANKSDYHHLKSQLESEMVPGVPPKPFVELPRPEQQSRLKDRLKKYCQKVYKRVMDKPVTELREAGVCMRENPFYADTVRSFRDRRYEYKGLNKVWKGRLSEAKAGGNPIAVQEARDMVVLYDSLQLAHKCILNSFYGYVMRKGARWYSMEMAGVVTYTGAKIIQNARLLVERIGKPLELDTDGIWCALPGSFPESFTFEGRDGKRNLTISYPCVVLNAEVVKNNTNDQYQTLVDPVRKIYETRSECSIEFEVDGPYKAMILPASKEEGILIKKRYAVFNDDGSLAELKGFEIKRRGELKLIKVFQAELFDKFLHGSTLEECYAAVASVANRWLDLLDNQGRDIADSELIDYISESSTMSKSLADYGEQKSCAVTTAIRLADFLGDSMVKDKGLRCQYIVACEPRGMPVSARAVPVAIFETDAEILRFYVRKWCKISSEVGVRSIIDWSYYKQRLSSAIQKIITIPAAMQKVANPVPRVAHPDWLHKKVREMQDKFHQKKLVDIFGAFKRQTANVMEEAAAPDFEDFGNDKSRRSLVSGGGVHGHERDDDVPMAPDPEEDVICKEPTVKSVDYGGWLKEQKRKWNAARERRKRQKITHSNEPRQILGRASNFSGSSINLKQLKGRVSVDSYFQMSESAITNSHWQIVQLVPSSHPGRFHAWVVCEGSMFKVVVTVPRIFYLNSRAPVTEDFPGRCVSRTLPHGHVSHNLIEIVVDEEQFITESKKLAAHLVDPEEVEGAYEMKIPLEFNAILQIGCVCKVEAGAKKRNGREGWNLRELCMKTTTEFSYLDHSIAFVYLYSSVSDGRAVYILHFSESKSVHIVVVNPFSNKEISASIMEKVFYDCYNRPVSEKGFFFKVEYVGNVEDADKFVQRTFVYHRSQHRGPALVAMQCQNTNLMKSRITALDDFPCVVVPFNAHDAQYRAVGWQIVAAKVGIRRLVASFQWLDERIALSRYAHIPLGNFENLDPLMFTCDVFFARALRDHQHVLWISDDGVPDLGGGGVEVEDTSFADEVCQPGVSNPGAYRKVAVEVKVHHISVIALLQSHVVNEIWGGDPFGFDGNPNYGGAALDDRHCGFDEAVTCGPAFRVLKQLVGRCVSDALGNGNIFADVISHRLYQWICSPRSKHHDPALHRTLHKVMQKVFALLLMECKKMGASIVSANFSKIILDTGKFDLDSAKAYCHSLIKTIQTNDLFEWISLEPEHYWHSLIFMDRYNFGGTRARMPSESSEENTEEEEEGEQVDVISNWHIAECLPKPIQEQFILTVSEFIHLPWKDLHERHDGRGSAVSAAEKVDWMVRYLKEKVGSYFTSKILRIVQGLEKNKDDGSLSLEFIKHVCAVMALDETVVHDVMVMRKNLLKYVRVREFSAEAEFGDSCPSFILPNVSCAYCHDIRDVDLCRDSACLEEEWHCPVPQCGHPYDREVMENALLQIARQRERVYHLQDIVCVKCSEVKSVHLNEQCQCGGLYRCREDASEYHFKMKVFLEIACRQNFPILKECITWILGR